jgi:hypothetical protein
MGLCSTAQKLTAQALSLADGCPPFASHQATCQQDPCPFSLWAVVQRWGSLVVVPTLAIRRRHCSDLLASFLVCCPWIPPHLPQS